MPAPQHPAERPEIFTVVLTGGIASGKTVVSDHFASLGVPIIDTDRIAHELVEPGRPALRLIAQALGAGFLDAEGRLDRRRMREAIFANPALRQQLEGILHPLIAGEALRRVRVAQGPYCLLVVPLYTASARWGWIDRVLVVDVDEAVQVERVMTRDRVDRDHAEAILRAQSSREERLALADDVIENNGALADLRVQVDRLHRKYLTQADK